jgi:hypothetical protein
MASLRAWIISKLDGSSVPVAAHFAFETNDDYLMVSPCPTPQPSTLVPQPSSLNREPATMSSSLPYTLNPKPYIPKPYIIVSALYPKPYIPKPYIIVSSLNPKT